MSRENITQVAAESHNQFVNERFLDSVKSDFNGPKKPSPTPGCGGGGCGGCRACGGGGCAYSSEQQSPK